MIDEPDLHPNLADALDGDDVDGAQLAAVARLLADLPVLDAPPAGAFDAIAAQAFAAPAPSESSRVRVISDVRADRLDAPDRRRWALWAAAAGVVVVVGLIGAVVTGSGDAPAEQRVELVALDGFEDADGSAVVSQGGGERTVEIDLQGVEVPAGSHLEVWLLDRDVSQTTSLGVVTDGLAHNVPAGADLAVTPLIDVSLEPDDGDAAHSGVSVVRGEIDPS